MITLTAADIETSNPMPTNHPDDLAYRVRLRDADGTSRVIYGPPDDDDDPTASESREYTAADPVLAELARHPYDPVVAARATGRLMGLTAAQARDNPWTRILAGIFGVALLAGGLAGAALWAPYGLALCLAGAVMLWRTTTVA